MPLNITQTLLLPTACAAILSAAVALLKALANILKSQVTFIHDIENLKLLQVKTEKSNKSESL